VSVQRLFTTVLSSLGLMLLAGVACHDMAPAVTGVPKRSGLIAFQGNGATSISSSNNTYFDIFVVNPDGSRLTNLTKRAGRNLHPAWSPDGSMIAFYADAAPAGLHLMKANGTGLRALVSSPQDDSYPSWSPDGSRIVLQRNTSESRIFVVNVDGTNARDLHSGFEPAWSPDGHTIAFSNFNFMITLMTTLGDSVRSIPGADGGAPAWSPDGSMIAFHKYSPAPQSIHVMQADGSQLRRLTAFPNGGDWTPSWSPDGNQIVFIHEIGSEGFNLYVINVDGTGMHEVPTIAGYRPTW